MSAPVFLQRAARGVRPASGRSDRAGSPGPDAHPSPLDLGQARELAQRAVRDRVLPCAAFGVADSSGIRGLVAVSGPRSRVTDDSILFMASVTKAIVATAVMQYVDEGRLDLHAPLATYLPAFSGGGRDAVTAWHVLTHTSGLPDTDIDALRRERPSYARSLEDVLARVPAWTPGSRYEYNSSAWMLLSETISRLSGMPFPTALALRLTRPLGMLDTTFDPRHARRRIVPMNGFAMRNRLVEEVLLRFLVRATLPGGGMFGTVADLLRLGRALLPAGPTAPLTPPEAGASAPERSAAPPAQGIGVRILSRRAIEEMSRLQTEGIPHVAPDGSRSFVPQALGWRKPSPGWPDRPSVITHGGISGSRLWIDPEADLAFAFLTNLWEAPDDTAIGVLEEVYRAVE